MHVEAGIPQSYILEPFFKIYIDDLPNNLTSNTKLFADETSFFSAVVDPNIRANQINNDLHKINKWKTENEF